MTQSIVFVCGHVNQLSDDQLRLGPDLLYLVLGRV